MPNSSTEPHINDLKKGCAINSYSITGMFKKDGNKKALTFTRLTQAEIYLPVSGGEAEYGSHCFFSG